MPAILSRFVQLADESGLVPLEDVIAANLELLFPGMEIASRYPFRVTRASDLEIDDDDAEDLLRAIEAELQRHRTNPVVRLEVARRMPGHLVHLLTPSCGSTRCTCIGWAASSASPMPAP